MGTPPKRVARAKIGSRLFNSRLGEPGSLEQD